MQLSFRTWWLKLLDRSLTQWLQEVESYRQRHNWEWAEWYKRLHRTISIELIRLDIHHLIEWSCFILSMLFNLRTELWGGGLNKIASTLRKHSLVDLGNIQYTHVQYMVFARNQKIPLLNASVLSFLICYN